MLPSLLLLSTSLLSMPVIISEVKATRESDHLRIEVRGDGGIDPETARTRIDEGSLYLFLGGTRVKADNRAWNLDLGVGEIRAHRHRTETELDVPLVGNGCAGPVELQGTSTGMIALVGCEGAAPVSGARGTARRTASPVTATVTKDVAKVAVPTAEPKPMARVALDAKPEHETAPAKNVGKAAAPSLSALVALPASDEAPVVKATSAAPVVEPAQAHGPSAKKRVEAEATPTSESDKSDKEAAAPSGASADTKAADTKAADAKAAVLPGMDATKNGSFGTAGSASAGLGIGKLAVPVILLAAVAIAAYLFTRRKRAASHRQIEILESASLGPKRSLIVARIGDETLFLGSSEAGITLLKSSAPAQAAPSSGGEGQRGPVVNELDQSLTDALADVPEPTPPIPVATPASFRSIEGGLATLFGRGATKVPPRPEARSEVRSDARFDEILEDSLEDQELRSKLAAGMSARVR